ncbi:MAG: DUF2341 domain-containing protein, partial [Verrucomicrobiota bacterium]
GATNYYTFRGTNCVEDQFAIPSVAFMTIGEAPVVDNGSGATDLGVDTATLQGRLTAGNAADVTVYWGNEDGGTDPGMWDHSANLGQILEGPFGSMQSGFIAGIQYYYRMFATNLVGSDWSDSPALFKSVPPVATIGRGFTVRTYDTVWGAGTINPLGNLLLMTPTDTHTLNGSLDYGDFASLQADYPSLTADDFYTILWTSVLRIDGASAGDYTFGTASDDGSVLYIDLNHDGDFDDPGELVVDNNGDHGRVEVMGTVNLPAGCYNVAVAFYENGGGEEVEAKFRRGTGYTYPQLDFFDGGSGPFFFQCPAEGQFLLELTGVSGITASSAVLSADFMASGSVECVSVYWGPTDGGSNPTAWSNVAAIGCFTNAPLTGLSRPLGGLMADQTYYYAYRSTNCSSDVWTPSEAFQTELVLGNFSFNRKFRFCGYDRPETLTGFPALVEFGTNIQGFAYSQMASGAGGDLRFLSGDMSQTLDFEIESWNPAGQSYVWVNVPALVDSNTCIYAYWGNASVTSLPVYATDGSTWKDDYIAVYHLNNTLALDSSGNGWNGTSMGNVDGTGRINGGQFFNGASVITAGPGINLVDKSFTVSAWLRRPALGTEDWVIFHGTGGQNNRALHFGYRANDEFAFAFWGNDLNLPGQAQADTWQHFTGVFDGTTFDQTLYRNGRLIGSRNTGTGYQGDPGTLLRIGDFNGGAGFDGELDEVRVACDHRSSNWVWATWHNVASNAAFICYDVAGPTGTVDLALSKTVSSTNLLVGTGLVYTVTVMNVSASIANGVVVTDTLPAGVTYVTSTPPAVINGNELSLNVGSMAGGMISTAIIEVAVTTAVPGAVTNWASVITSELETVITNNLARAVTVIPDSDNDGVANPADPDDDNDGVDDEAEGIAGTDPTDPADFFWVRIMRTGALDAQDLIFPTRLGRRYRIERSQNLQTGPWVNVRSNIPGTGGPLVIPETNGVQRLYYRIGVETP